MTDFDYPTEEDLECIRNAPPSEVLAIARHLWAYPEYWTVGPYARWGESRTVHDVSTGGWSGNEDIIGAMQDNTAFWVMHWEESRRGGHYKFRETP